MLVDRVMEFGMRKDERPEPVEDWPKYHGGYSSTDPEDCDLSNFAVNLL